MGNKTRLIARLLSVVSLACFCTELYGALPVEVAFASLPAAQLGDGWSEVRKDGGVAYRAAPKGRREFYVPAWWKKGDLRPPAGEYYLVELGYKDTFHKPAVFYAGGGIAPYFALSEVHRFGGTGDGRWKTARIPLSWEYVCRRVHPVRNWRSKPDMAFFAIGGAEEIPVKGFTLRQLQAAELPALRASFFAEIRRFNALEQAGGRAKHPCPQAEGTVAGFPGALAAFPWQRPESLMPDHKPTAAETGKKISVRMCLDEIEPIPFGVFANGKDLTNVRYTLGPLKGKAGTLDADITPRTAELTLVRRNKAWFWLPHRLWPAYTVEKIPAGRSHYFVVNVRARNGRTRPGTYTGSVKITCDQGSVVLDVELEVLPLRLPSMDELGLYFGGCTTGLVPVSDVRFQVSYNQNATNLWYAGVFPYNVALKPDGTMVLDYVYMDDWLPRARAAGLCKVVYFLGGDPYRWPRTVTLARELNFFGQEEKGKNARNDAIRLWYKRQGAKEAHGALLPETRKLYVQWVKQFMAHARKRGWPEMILTPFDEPAKWRRKGPWLRDFFKDCCAAIHAGDSKARVYASIHDLRRDWGTTFIPDVEVFCTNAIIQNEKAPELVREASGKAVKKGGRPKEFWQYSFVGYSRPEYIRYTMGFFFGYYGTRGGLIWAYNWEAGWNAARSGWRYAWQTPLGTIPGNFFEGVREGLDDRRLIETYRKKHAGDAQARQWLAALLQEARSARGRSGRSRVNDFWTGIKDPSLLVKWREKLLDRLVGK